MTYLIIDIETVINDEFSEAIKSIEIKPDKCYANTVNPPDIIMKTKDPELKAAKILEWKTEKENKQQQNIMEKRSSLLEGAGLHWWSCKIICISAVLENQPKSPSVWYSANETNLLSKFFSFLTSKPDVKLCGKNITDFDIPILIGRAMRHNLGVPLILKDEHRHFDIDKIFGWSRTGQQRSSLDNYMFGIAIKGKNGKGTDVQDWYNSALQGDKDSWKRICDYCVNDSLLVLHLLNRYQQSFVGQSPVEFKDSEIPFGG